MAFWFFNFYPARAFEGNIGSMFFGSAIGCFIVIQNYWWFGFFILIPHIMNFFLWIIWLYLMKKNPEKYLEKDGNHKKFADLQEDNTIKVPNYLTLKWVPNIFREVGEKESTLYLYSLTTFFCLLGIIFV